MKSINFTIGSDPEFFLSIGGKYISAHNLFPGTKHEPYKLDRGAVQVDGLALEYNIDPASNEDEFDLNHKTVLSQIREMADNIDKDIKFNFVPYVSFDPEYFTKEIPDEAKVLGCSPDFNIHNIMQYGPKIVDRPFRTAAGHVHIGWTSGVDTESYNHFQDCLTVSRHFYRKQSRSPYKIRNLEESKRIRYYGKLGAFRPKEYGVELRTPSNCWVPHEARRKEMFRYFKKTMEEIPTAG